MNKKQLGQFFTQNSDYILDGLEKFIQGKNVVDPFAGNGDLIHWAGKNQAKYVKGYDIDKNYVDNKRVFLNDSILNPRKYSFILTNPPYLNVNKADKKIKQDYFNKFDFEDLYQISLKSIFESAEGIVILPINFLSAENSKKIRRLFFSKFKIVEMNYFKQQVFSDTTYNVIAFYYKKKNFFENEFIIKSHIYPDNKIMDIVLEKKFNWSIGGKDLSVIKKQENSLGVYRLTENDIKSGDIEIKVAFNHIKNIDKIKVAPEIQELIDENIILLKAIDSGTEKGKLSLENIKHHNLDCLISKESSRHMVYLVFQQALDIEKQKEIIKLFNQEINELRDNYDSLFLSNYRDNNRKRVSFDFVYRFINYLYYHKLVYNNIKQKELS